MYFFMFSFTHSSVHTYEEKDRCICNRSLHIHHQQTLIMITIIITTRRLTMNKLQKKCVQLFSRGVENPFQPPEIPLKAEAIKIKKKGKKMRLFWGTF